MSQVIGIPDAVEDVVIDLWGTKFVAVPPTKALAEETADDLVAITLAVASPDSGDFVKALGAFLDKKLRPQGSHKKKPSNLIKAKWDANGVTIPQLAAFVENIRDAERPI